MTRSSDDTDQLLARADAAVVEARRLVDENRRWQQDTGMQMRKMRFRASFYPQSLKLFSPPDFLPRRLPPRRTDGVA